MRAAFLALLVVVAVPVAGWAGTPSNGCGFSGTAAGTAGTATGSSATSTRISRGDIWCYRFVNADATTTIIGPLNIEATEAIIWFDPDLFQAITTTARLIPHFCPQGAAVNTSSAANIFLSCPGIGGAGTAASLDGTEGPDGTQNQAKRVGPGHYYFEISAVCEAGDTCQIAVKAEDAGTP